MTDMVDVATRGKAEVKRIHVGQRLSLLCLWLR